MAVKSTGAIHLMLMRMRWRGVQVVAAEGVIYMVLEYGDIDLARLLGKQEAARRAAGNVQPDENFIRLYWQQMLQVWLWPYIPSNRSDRWRMITCTTRICAFHFRFRI